LGKGKGGRLLYNDFENARYPAITKTDRNGEIIGLQDTLLVKSHGALVLTSGSHGRHVELAYANV
jgi:hypothetical protein